MLPAYSDQKSVTSMDFLSICKPFNWDDSLPMAKGGNDWAILSIPARRCQMKDVFIDDTVNNQFTVLLLFIPLTGRMENLRRGKNDWQHEPKNVNDRDNFSYVYD